MIRHTARDAGSASIELAILAPAVLAMFVAVLIGGRTNLARQSVEAAAFDAARTASLERTAGAAQAQASAAAFATLAGQGLHCSSTTVAVSTDGFAVPVGQPATVTATVTCRLSYADIALPGMPGGAILTYSFESPLDKYRSRA